MSTRRVRSHKPPTPIIPLGAEAKGRDRDRINCQLVRFSRILCEFGIDMRYRWLLPPVTPVLARYYLQPRQITGALGDSFRFNRFFQIEYNLRISLGHVIHKMPTICVRTSPFFMPRMRLRYMLISLIQIMMGRNLAKQGKVRLKLMVVERASALTAWRWSRWPTHLVGVEQYRPIPRIR